jgi:hypothetical protein
MIDFWKSIGTDIIISIFQCLDCIDLESLQYVNQYFNTVIVNECRVWKNAVLPLISGSHHLYFKQHPGQKHVGKVALRISRRTEDFFFSLLPFLDRVDSLDLFYSLPSRQHMQDIVNEAMTLQPLFLSIFSLNHTLQESPEELVMKQIGPSITVLRNILFFQTLHHLKINSP